MYIYIYVYMYINGQTSGSGRYARPTRETFMAIIIIIIISSITINNYIVTIITITIASFSSSSIISSMFISRDLRQREAGGPEQLDLGESSRYHCRVVSICYFIDVFMIIL